MISSAQNLVERACELAGSSDLGPVGWEPGLEALVSEARIAGLRPHSVDRLEAIIIDRLLRRLRIEDWYRDHPAEVMSVDAITVITGLPRTATTAMQHLLALDPRHRFQRGWEIRSPVPPPRAEDEVDDERRLAALRQASGAEISTVQFIATVDGPVDDGNLLGLGFHNQELGLPLDSYTRWWRSADLGETYAYHRRVLELLHTSRPPRSWLVKAPYHLFHLDDLVANYPNAKFVMTHRDPAATVPSACSTVDLARRSGMPDEMHDKKKLGSFLLEHLTDGISRAMQSRERIGEDRFCDVSQQQLEADPVQTLERVYRFLGIELGDRQIDQILSWASDNRPGVRGAHHYQAADYGLAVGQIREAFAAYISRFGVVAETVA
jgi:hypothetical protein